MKNQEKQLARIWSKCVGAGRAAEGLREGWRKQLKRAVEECGFEYIRFHGLLHDDMCVYRVINGEEVYNFQYIDDVFDFLLSINIRPFVEFGFMPEDMAEGQKYQFWWKGNITPPKDMAKWETLIKKLMERWIARYGRAEVSNWYFEVWNEPNLHNAFWSGGKAKYFELYRATSLAVKSFGDEFRVGGPATSNFVPDERFDGDIEDTSKHMTHQIEDLDSVPWKPVWMAEFLAFCEENDLPLDFVSCHPYPTDFALDGHGKSSGRSRGAHSTKTDIETLRKIIDATKYKGAPIHLTEWSSSPSSRDMSHDTSNEAAYIVMSNLECSGLAESLSYWTFSDVFEELGAGNKAFHGGFGMVNYQGIKKPSYHAYEFLNRLGDVEIERGDGYIVTRDSESGKLIALLYNYDEKAMDGALPISNTYEAAEELTSRGSEKCVEFELECRPGAKFSAEICDTNSGNVMKAYKELGYPTEPNFGELIVLKNVSERLRTEVLSADETGTMKLKRNLGPWAIELISEI